MKAFITSLFFLFLAEMADKTQLLTIGFAARYQIRQVLTAVFIATFITNLLAVVFGKILTKIIPIDIISFIAALSFIIFGLLMLRGDKTGKDKIKKESKFGPIFAIAIPFFLAEMADKTQLATVSLCVKYQDAISVLFGATIGMFLANIIGITIGAVMHKHIPQHIIKWISAGAFVSFGCWGIFKFLY